MKPFTLKMKTFTILYYNIRYGILYSVKESFTKLEERRKIREYDRTKNDYRTWGTNAI